MRMACPYCWDRDCKCGGAERHAQRAVAKIADLRNKFGAIYTEAQLRIMSGQDDPLLKQIVDYAENYLKKDC